MDRTYEFSVNGNHFVFDGNTVSVYEKNNVIQTKKENTPKYLPRCNYLRTVCLVLNNSCNLCCSYCFANKGHFDKPYEQMKLEHALKAIDTTANIIKKNNGKKFTISFFGGEPLLSFSLIKKIVLYIQKQYPHFEHVFRITTNGTLLTQDIVLFLEKNPFEIMISIDGGKKEHDFFRKDINGNGSYDKIKNNLKYFKNISKLNARITITKANSNINCYIDDILNLGFRKITFAVDYAIEKDDFKNFKDSLKKLFIRYTEDIKKGFYYDITNISTVITSIVMKYKMNTHCNAGISYITLSADGIYYRCPRFVGNPLFYVSKIDAAPKVLDKSMAAFRNKVKTGATDRNDNCHKCAFVYLCGGACAHHAYMHSHEEFTSVDLECQQRKLIYKETLNLICKLTIEERKKFLLFLTTLWSKA